MKLGNKKRYKTSPLRGFTIIEVMMAVTVLSVGIMGVVSAINYNISVASNAVNRTIAANLAQEGIELVRNIRDTNWITPGNAWDDGGEWETSGVGIKGRGGERAIKFFCGGASVQNISENNIDDCSPPNGNACQVYIYKNASDNSLCYSDNFGDQDGYSIEKQTGFYRLIKLDRLPGPVERIQVSAYVKWSERNGQNRYLTAGEILYNWK